MSFDRILALALVWASPAAAQFTEHQAPPAAVQKLDVPLEPTVDVSRYSTYTWNKAQVRVENLANHIRLINAVQKQMKHLGYRIDTIKPQLFVQYKVERRTAIQTRSTQTPSAYDPSNLKVQIDLNKEEQVTLTIELVDAESNFLVWREQGTYPLGTPDKSEKLINDAVADLFSRFPTSDSDKGDKDKKDKKKEDGRK